MAVALTSALMACSGGVEEPAQGAAFVESTTTAEISPALGAARQSQSAAELADDFTQTLSFARQQAESATTSDSTTDATSAPAPASTSEVTLTPATTSESASASAPSNSIASNNPLAVTPSDVNSVTPETTTGVVDQVTTEELIEESNTNANPATAALTPLAPAPGSIVDDTPDDTVGTEFLSQTTDGFTGTILDDGTIKVIWDTDQTARGYNVYRQAEYITTVFENEYIDTDVFDTNYYYEIQAFDFADNFSRIATGLTVKVRGLDKPDPNAPATNAAQLQDYELVFSDEFQGTTLDSSKWNTAYLWEPHVIINSEEQYYVDINNEPDFGFNPFTFDGENITINSIPTPDALKSKALDQPYLSGVINSYNKFNFTYGYVETRAKVPYGKGYWPAFWLLNAVYVDDEPEIDIMEFIGDDQDVVFHTYHYYDSNGELRSTKSQATPGIDYTSDFHTYAVEWKPGTLIYYVDGVEAHRVVDPKVSQQDMYVIANTAVGGWWPGSPDATTPFPGEFKIDYIRVYQKSTPLDDFIFDDLTTNVAPANSVLGTSPNHRPPFALWPEGYPDR